MLWKDKLKASISGASSLLVSILSNFLSTIRTRSALDAIAVGTLVIKKPDLSTWSTRLYTWTLFLIDVLTKTGLYPIFRFEVANLLPLYVSTYCLSSHILFVRHHIKCASTMCLFLASRRFAFDRCCLIFQVHILSSVASCSVWVNWARLSYPVELTNFLLVLIFHIDVV